MDFQVKIRGFRIELGEIEAVLNAHPQVKEAVVVSVGDTPDDQRLVAYIVGEQTAPPSATSLRRILAGKLPDYMIPNVFVAMDGLPLTPHGKIDRQALPAPELDRT
jgi:acyl-coenzyme A synthetase/AMP-(fatty) acid ligase